MSNTTRLIDKLIIRQFVEKKINSNNKRKIDIIITNEGIQFLEKIDQQIDNTEKSIVNSLSNHEAEELIRLLDKLKLIDN